MVFIMDEYKLAVDWDDGIFVFQVRLSAWQIFVVSQEMLSHFWSRLVYCRANHNFDHDTVTACTKKKLGCQ